MLNRSSDPSYKVEAELTPVESDTIVFQTPACFRFLNRPQIQASGIDATFLNFIHPEKLTNGINLDYLHIYEHKNRGPSLSLFCMVFLSDKQSKRKKMISIKTAIGGEQTGWFDAEGLPTIPKSTTNGFCREEEPWNG